MRIAIITFVPGLDWGQQRKATELVTGWHVADYSMDRQRVRLTFFDDVRAAAAVPILAASPHVADVHLEEIMPHTPPPRRRR